MGKIESVSVETKRSERETPKVQFAVILLSVEGSAGSRLQRVPVVPCSPMSNSPPQSDVPLLFVCVSFRAKILSTGRKQWDIFASQFQ